MTITLTAAEQARLDADKIAFRKVTGSITALPKFTVEDSTKSFTVDELIGKNLLMSSGVESGNNFLIISNTATLITLNVQTGGIIVTDTYTIPTTAFTGSITAIPADNFVEDTSQSFTNNELASLILQPTSGAENGTNFDIVSNTATLIQLSGGVGSIVVTDAYKILGQKATSFEKAIEGIADRKASIQLDEDIFDKFREEGILDINASLDGEVTVLDTAFPTTIHTKNLGGTFPASSHPITTHTLHDPKDWTITEKVVGTSTAVTPGSPNSIVGDTSKTLVVNRYTGETFKVTSGALNGTTGGIVSNTANQFTIAVDLTGMIVGDTYEVIDFVVFSHLVNFTPGTEPEDTLLAAEGMFDIFEKLISSASKGTVIQKSAMDSGITQVTSERTDEEDKTDEYFAEFP